MDAATDGLISGRYRLGELLGTGGSASVFLAVDTSVPVETVAGAAVALKILHPHLSRSEQAREAFFAEARAASALRHPNIVAVLGVGLHGSGQESLAWIALELAPGLSLAEHVERHGALAVRDALTIGAGVLLALDMAHRHGLIHRDISPANVMVEPNPGDGILVAGVRLLDFGLADAAGRAVLGADVLRSPAGPGPNQELGVLGSANYMSPEHAQGSAVDERGDIYQLGAVLHFALTGRPPYLRDSASAVMRAHVQSPPPVPSAVRSGIPRGVDRIVVKAMLKDPSSRYQSAAEMGDAIAAARTGGNGGDDRTGGNGGVDRTTVLDASLARTAVLARASTAAAGRPPGAQRPPRPAAAGPARAGRRRGRGRSGTWVAGLLMAGVFAVAWATASQRSAQSSVAEISVPSAVAGTGPTAAATPSEAPSEAPSESPSESPSGSPSEAPIERVLVPELTSMMLGQARAALEAAGLRLGGVSIRESVWVGDTVLEVLPAPGEWISAGDTVDLVVASGSNRVPSVAGLPAAVAISALHSAGFVAVTVRSESASSPADTVLGSAPGEGAVLRLGTSVTITVSIAPPPAPSPPASPTPTQTPTGTPAPAATSPAA